MLKPRREIINLASGASTDPNSMFTVLFQNHRKDISYRQMYFAGFYAPNYLVQEVGRQKYDGATDLTEVRKLMYPGSFASPRKASAKQAEFNKMIQQIQQTRKGQPIPFPRDRPTHYLFRRDNPVPLDFFK